MKLSLTDKEKIARRRCETKGCPNKAAALFERKYLCKECNIRINPKPKDKRLYYVR